MDVRWHYWTSLESEGQTYTCYSHAPLPFKYINPCDTVCVIGIGCSCGYAAIIQTTVYAFHMPPCPEVIVMSPFDLHRSCGGWVWYSTSQENEYPTASHYKNKQKFSYITGRLGMVDYYFHEFSISELISCTPHYKMIVFHLPSHTRRWDMSISQVLLTWQVLVQF